MAVFTTDVYSENLGFDTNIGVIIPQRPTPSGKVLYLLHGMGGNASAWTKCTRIIHYAHERDYVVVMPEAQRSFFMDMAHGPQYCKYITEELPKLCGQLFGIKHRREKTFIAGLSMGGYGALLCGLSKPAFYSAIASFSGAVDAERWFDENKKDFREFNSIVGNGKSTTASNNFKLPASSDIFRLSEKISKLPEKKKPRILSTCGSGDFLIEDNRKYAEFMKGLPIDFEYKEWDGVHDWNFWEQSLNPMFDFFDKGGEK